MQVMKLMPKVAPYLLVGAAMVGVSTTKLCAANDRFEKKEPVTVTVEDKKSEDTIKKGIPWGEIIPVGCMLGLIGTILLAERLDKKIDEKAASKAETGNGQTNIAKNNG